MAGKILLIGADGQLGTDLQKIIPLDDLIPLTISDLNITDKQRTIEVVNKHNPRIVINTAAYHQVDNCEDNQALAYQVNEEGVENLCLACRQAGSALVQISTDYVFDGKKRAPYTEADEPNPQSVYAKSKLAGEKAVQARMDKYYIVRSCGLYGVAGCMATSRLNFIETMIKIGREQGKARVVFDQIVSPTYTLDLANKIVQLVKTGEYGVYHIVNHGECSWHSFAEKALKLCGLQVELEKITSKKYGANAPRPAYSVLDNHNLRKMGLDDLRSWDKALEAYLKEKGHIK